MGDPLWQRVVDKAVGIFTPSEADLQRSEKRRLEMGTPKLLDRRPGPVGRQHKATGTKSDLLLRKVPKALSRAAMFDAALPGLQSSGNMVQGGIDQSEGQQKIKGFEASRKVTMERLGEIWDTEFDQLLAAGVDTFEIHKQLGPRPEFHPHDAFVRKGTRDATRDLLESLNSPPRR